MVNLILIKRCELEYKHMAEIVGEDNLLITNIKNDKYSFFTEQSVLDLDIPFDKVIKILSQDLFIRFRIEFNVKC